MLIFNCSSNSSSWGRYPESTLCRLKTSVCGLRHARHVFALLRHARHVFALVCRVCALGCAFMLSSPVLCCSPLFFSRWPCCSLASVARVLSALWCSVARLLSCRVARLLCWLLAALVASVARRFLSSAQTSLAPRHLLLSCFASLASSLASSSARAAANIP